MLSKVVKKIFGSRNERYIKSLQKNVDAINALEPEVQALSDDALRAKTQEFRERFASGEKLDNLLNEAFAVCREAAVRTIGLRHYDVQLIGGIVLHEGKIAEMRTGEGKTLVATLAVYLNALTGNGVHVITVNDYLAKRDAELMGQVYQFLGLTTGVSIGDMEMDDKRKSYQCDIVYGTNNELGFDYLRTNMALKNESRIQKKLAFAIVDEVDSILIDEARTPLVISGQVDQDNQIYARLNKIVPHLEKQERIEEKSLLNQNSEEEAEGDFTVDEKDKTVSLTEKGHDKVEHLLQDAGLLKEGESIYHPDNINLFHHLNSCIRAHYLYQKDVDYIVRNNEVVIVDEFTGRTMTGRRWSDGLHQAIEAKEGVEIRSESQTMASITFQNYFRQYEKLAGMTGTADTEAYEFEQIYSLETIIIPTHVPIQRDDQADAIFLNQQGKFNAIIQDIIKCHEKGQPVLVGTTSIEMSELIGQALSKTNIPFEVLNAKQHEKEALIIENAGCIGAVTIATNMAGRGTDIVLGGNLEAKLAKLSESATREEIDQIKAKWKEDHDKVLKSGGLKIIGTERHESRRIDNQLRGRSGRQGDPGSSKFYLSLDDSLMRIFASPRMKSMMERLGMKDDEAIEHKMVSNAIENAQRKVEAHNFDARKQLIEYDDVSNEQRKIIYSQRDELMDSENISDYLDNMREDAIEEVVDTHLPEYAMLSEWDKEGLAKALLTDFNYQIDFEKMIADNKNLDQQNVKQIIVDGLKQAYADKMNEADEGWRKSFEKIVTLQIVDEKWVEHLKAMEYLRQSIQLRASRAQKDPRQEYKREAFELFQGLLNKIAFTSTRFFALVDFGDEKPWEPGYMPYANENNSTAAQPQNSSAQTNEMPSELSEVQLANTPRNAQCPCGSGEKFKRCHGKV